MADLVFCTSPALLEKCKVLNENSTLQPNVADYAHFSKACDPGTEIPDNLKTIKKKGPIVAFAGNLVEYKVDFPLIANAAQKMPDTQFILIGPEWEGNPSGALDELKALTNVHFIGFVEYEDLPDHLASADALMMPYRLTDHTKNIFPLKFFEFLATGKPVVSTALPTLAKYNKLVPLTLNTDEFTKALEDALAEAQNSLRDDRLTLARQNTWESRINAIIDFVRQRLHNIS
jgi:glycosyltransferase involved in cell wall biosynthesis